MIRTVNLIDYLPLYVQEYREIQGIMDTENIELQSMEDDSEKIKDNAFVLYADEKGIARYEKMFGLTPSKGDSLYSRQMAVLTRYTNTSTYTMRGLIDRLNAICGVGNYSLKLNANEYKVTINLHVRVKNLLNVVGSMLKDMIPANMLYMYAVNYNTHEVLSDYPTYLLMQFSHQELYDEVIGEKYSSTCDNITNYTMGSFESVSCENMANFGMRKV